MISRWLRFIHEGEPGYGTLSDDATLVRVHAGDMFGDSAATGQEIALADVTLLTPVTPGKLIGLWNNYHELAVKLSQQIPTEPLYFVKTSNSYLAPEGLIRSPRAANGRIFYEGELAIVIGRRCSQVSLDEANQSIFGYTCINDVTALEVLQRDSTFFQWVRAKSFDTFAPFGPVIAAGIDWQKLRVVTRLNGRERQNYPCSDMIFSPPQIVSHLSQDMTLEAGDLIACGTSIGSMPMKSGSTVEVEIASIGILKNTYLGPESE